MGNFSNRKWILVLSIVDSDGGRNEGNSQMLLNSLPSGYVILLGALNSASSGFPYVEVCMSFIHNHNFSIYFTLPSLKKRVLIISFQGAFSSLMACKQR
jgi:hypothetical protein